MTFTTTAFDCSSSWLFGAFSCKTTPKDLPSSSAQHALPALLDTSRPVHLWGSPLDYGPVLLLMPFRFHLTVDTLPSEVPQMVASGPPWSVSGFRLRARLGLAIPATFSGQRRIIAAFGYSAPHPSARGTSTLPNNALLSAKYAHTDIYSMYIRDRWQVSPRLTASFGVRWEYFPFPRRAERGLERYDFNTNEVLVCGFGSIPTNCGNNQSKTRFLPRAGLAFRASENFVIRAGYGITIDPYPIALTLRGNYPTQVAIDLPFDDSRGWSTTLDRGLPYPLRLHWLSASHCRPLSVSPTSTTTIIVATFNRGISHWSVNSWAGS